MIGIMSDSHEQEEATQKAVEIFRERKVDFVVHCGDIISPLVMKNFRDLKMIFVFGNNDGETTGLNKKAKEFGFENITDTKKFKYKGKMFFVCHGHDMDILGSETKSGENDYIFTGHTHEKKDLKIGNTHIINPGTLFREPKTIAVLDEQNNELEFIEI